MTCLEWQIKQLNELLILSDKELEKIGFERKELQAILDECINWS
jgi:uncharacterized protein YjiS (DUF1127 family)